MKPKLIPVAYRTPLAAGAYLLILTIVSSPSLVYGQNLFDTNKDKVVRIVVQGRDANGYDRPRSGSGFFIHPDGFLLTALHVVGTLNDWYREGNDRIDRKIELSWIDSNGITRQEKTVVVVYYDTVVDLALLRVGLSNVPFLRLGDSRLVKSLQKVIAIGYPRGEEKPKPTEGSISLPFDSAYGGFFTFAGNINVGNSGGPLLNEDGQVVGVVNAGLPYSPGVGFAIPINLASGLVQRIIRPPRFDQ